MGLLLALVLASSLTCAGVGLLIGTSPRGEVSLASIPLYPRAENVETTGEPTDTFRIVTFETADSEQSVHSHYAGVLPGPVWTASTLHSQGEVTYTSMGMPDFGKVQVRWDPGSLLPTIEIPRKIYRVQVVTGREDDNTTGVWVILDVSP